MNTPDKISFFMELINCSYDLYIWSYDKDMNMVHTNWTESIFSGNFLSYTGLSKLVEEHIASGKKTPLILEATGNLLWIAGFVYNGSLLENFYLIGPIYSGRDSQMLLRKHLDEYDLTVKLRSMVFKLFERIPTVPTNIINQYAVMLHYCLTNAKISTNDITYQSIVPATQKKDSPASSFEHAGIWYAEERLFKMIADGDPNYKEALAKSASLSSGMKTDSRDSLRRHKNNTLVLLTLCSRACIRGGLAPSISYDLNDFYASKIEECNSMSEMQKLNESMLADYVYRVRKSKEESQTSAPIRNACAYIKSHITESLSIAVLAKQSGYSEYYFSHKFKQETGTSINDYILKEKIDQAKLLLSGTTENIQTISDNLSFSNRSYFYTCFQKLVGMSPSEYRSQNHRI
ncbi:helix-turn-helix transcriptional regulator [Clostridium sp. C105KSO13]|uniref:helix-turn-helix transcriptional regulator n=1 Tax=Clostridium sp. C105KSO13 TaxID=1776045 RepID=UPI000740702B|nr:AraC family transcriptional regulator [Clostridium sp. C105KSO13]CUX25124.1 Arabinose operon regulatory protein [Clostridium sp. C105KSO13]